MLSSEFLVDLAEEVYGTLRSLEGTSRLAGEADGPSPGSGGEISAPHVLAGFTLVGGRTCSFVETLFALMEEKGIGDAELSAKVGWSPEALRGLWADRHCCPVKELVFAFGLALGLNRDEMRRLTASAGYALSKEEVGDIVLLYCVDRGVFDLGDVNEALRCFNLKPIVIRPLKGRTAEGPGPA